MQSLPTPPRLPVPRSTQNFFVGLLLVLATAVWGYTFPVVKDAIAVYGVVPFLAVRFALAALCLLPFCLGRLRKSTVAYGGLIGLPLAGGFLFQTFGLDDTTATNCGLITGLFVVFALLFNYLLFRIRVTLWGWLAVGLSLAGLALLTQMGCQKLSWGDVLTLGAVLCFGLQVALLDHWAKFHDPVALTCVQILVLALLFLPLWPAAEKPAVPPLEVWFALLLTSLVATAAGLLIQVLAQQRLSAVRCAMIFTLEPVFAALFGYLCSGDRLMPIQWVGALLMVAAVLMAETGKS